MKVLITGEYGRLGRGLVKAFTENYDVVSTNRQDLDITDLDQTRNFIKKENPKIVIHSAAWTDVEGCAKDPDRAMSINGEGAKNVAQTVKEIDGKMVYISTNEVFDGAKDEPYDENDQTSPINSYGRSKLQGERYCQEILEQNCMIIRTAWLYGPEGQKNFPSKIISIADKNQEISVVDDEISTPTYTPELARAIKILVEKEASGVFHLVNEGYCSRFDWARELLSLSGRSSVVPHPIKFKDFNRLSTPPLQGMLKSSRIQKFNVKLPAWKESLKDFFIQRPDLTLNVNKIL